MKIDKVFLAARVTVETEHGHVSDALFATRSDERHDDARGHVLAGVGESLLELVGNYVRGRRLALQ